MATVEVGDCLPVLSPSSIAKALMNWSELGGGQPRWSACWMERVPCEKMLGLQGSFDPEKRIFGAWGAKQQPFSICEKTKKDRARLLAVVRQQAQAETREVQTRKEKLSHQDTSQAVDQVARRDCAVSVLRGFQDRVR